MYDYKNFGNYDSINRHLPISNRDQDFSAVPFWGAKEEANFS